MDPNSPPTTEETTGTPPSTVPANTDPPPESGKNIMIPARAMTNLKQDERRKGAAEALAELDKQAQAKGFANLAAMMQRLDAVLAAPPKPAQAPPNRPASGAPPKPQQPANKNDHKAMQRSQADIDHWKRENEKNARALADEQRRRRTAERSRDAIEAKANLERIATRVGIRDTEYAIHLFNQHHQGMSVEQLEKVDESKFFAGLKKDHGYLFGETVVPATTGTAGGTPGAEHLAPGTVSTGAAEAGKTDVRKMSKPEFDEYKRKRRLDGSAAGLG